jgi:hypothetical protein
MSIDLSGFAADMQFILDDLPQTVSIGGTDYAAACDSATNGERLEVEGVYVDLDLVAHCRVDAFAGTLPAIGARLTHNGRTFRIMRLSHSPCLTVVRIDCQGLDQ